MTGRALLLLFFSSSVQALSPAAQEFVAITKELEVLSGIEISDACNFGGRRFSRDQIELLSRRLKEIAAILDVNMHPWVST